MFGLAAGPVRDQVSCDRSGILQAKTGFAQDIYRIGVHPLGHGFATMSRSCRLYAYGSDLDPLLGAELADVADVQALGANLAARMTTCDAWLLQETLVDTSLPWKTRLLPGHRRQWIVDRKLRPPDFARSFSRKASLRAAISRLAVLLRPTWRALHRPGSQGDDPYEDHITMGVGRVFAARCEFTSLHPHI